MGTDETNTSPVGELIDLSASTNPPSAGNPRISKLIEDLFPLNLDETGIDFADPIAMREKIQELEDQILQLPNRMQIETTHTFSNGLYAREITIPKDALVTGKIHREESFCIMSRGDLLLVTEDGVRRVRAPYAVVARPGLKRAALALEDSVWTTIHATPHRDLEMIEKTLFAKDYEDVRNEADLLIFKTMEGSCPHS